MSLVYTVNKFLDSLEYQIDPDNLTEREYFTSIYTTISDNLAVLENFKVEMEFYGYPNPYYPLKGLKGSEPFFRNRAQHKKLAYKRNTYALFAHRIALEHLTESIMLSNKKTYRGRDALKYLGGDLTFSHNEEGVYRLELMDRIPLSGDYMIKLSNFTPAERKNYREILKMVDKEKGGLSSVSIYMKHNAGRTKRNLSLREYRNLREDREEIERFRIHRKKGGLIKNKYIRKILSISYAPFGVDIFLFDLALFYLKKGRYERERYAGIFPTLSSEAPDDTLGEYEEIIDLKEDLEDELQKLGKFEKSLLVGAIAYYEITGDREETLEYFGIDEKELTRKLEEFQSFGLLGERDLKPRTRKFLEYLQR
jgi:hypothetical protein